MVALEPLSMSLPAGEAVALLGRNGAGKTTALRIVSTLVAPSSGTVLVFDEDASRSPCAVRAMLGVSLCSERSFYWRLTSRHNLTFFARLNGVRGARASGQIVRLAAELDIERFLDRPVRALSRGALARLSFARACLGRPALFLLDEPFASVDERGRHLMLRALRRRLEDGAAAVIATHDRLVAEACERVTVLSPGRSLC